MIDLKLVNHFIENSYLYDIYETNNNEFAYTRNFDYKDSLCFVVWTSPENGYRSMTGTLGTFLLYGKKWQNPKNLKDHIRMMGAPYCCMDGVNEKGLAAAILEIKTKPTKQKTGKNLFLFY